MYLLKKVIQLRENSHPDHEKPFLDHLEDLRVMITRIVITLVVSMVICFTFQKQLMEVLRRPVEQVWITQLEAKLPQTTDQAPRPLGVDRWEEAKALEHAASALEPEQRALLYQSSDAQLVFHAKSVALLRAVLALPEEHRGKFIESLDAPKDLKRQVGALVKTAPSPEADTRGNLKLMSALKPTETFMLSMKLSFFAGIILAFPLLLMFVLQFILPGLHANEKRVLWPSMLIGFGLFIGGVLFAYYGVLPRALTFFYEWSGSLGVSNDWRIGEYISFATTFTLLFGLSFELPVVVMVFVKLGLLTYETMSRTRSYAILAIFVAAAVLTPTPDVFTLLLMALPMIVLYEICIWLAWLDRRKNRLAEEQEAREREEKLLTDGGDPFTGVASPDENPQQDPHATQNGDDGWTGEYPQQDFHDDMELPEITDLPDSSETPDGETKSKDEP
ncbi:MAG: twin-arginine translocase subunit TatC [Luteolibacter sp.]|jgi:sec-independent protein translocase protein TatC|nr:twin-arginine translocase subunit TatC [Luteolibacter sp.]